MSRYITITLERARVSCRARLLDEVAPATSQAVWNVLPQSGDAVHAKFARNEVYALVPRITTAPRRENPTVTPIPGDVCLFDFEPWEIGNPAYGYEADSQAHAENGATDLAIFYDRNNLLLGARQRVRHDRAGAARDGSRLQRPVAARVRWRTPDLRPRQLSHSPGGRHRARAR